MKIRITYCRHCYAKQARALSDELRGRPATEVESSEGKLGQFDVEIDGELVASRGEGLAGRLLHRGPDLSALIATIERHVAAEDGDACELPEPTGRS